jgi:curved DNA-binding protein CbpA
LKDYYAILGVERGVSARDIKRAYKKLVRKWHPDLHPDDPACRTKAQEINEAYGVLSDLEKRASYDRQIEAGRIFEAKGMGFHPDHHEHPFFSYFTRINEVLRKRTQK